MTVLSKACVCGHDHRTHRGEDVDLCLDCSCSEYVERCQNCGEEAWPIVKSGRYDACSRRCALQLEYASTRATA